MTDNNIPAGQSFGRLTVIGVADVTKSGRKLWLCRCVCGNETKKRPSSLRSGRSKSCGCLRKEVSAAMAGSRCSHGQARNGKRTSAYRSWEAMKQRCFNTNHKFWNYYGGAGITVCHQWVQSFEVFFEDMGEKPPGFSLDRYPDPFGNYEPSNCRWATQTQQQNNRRDNTPRPS